MTPDEFIALIRFGSPNEIAEKVEAWTESERRALSKTAQFLWKDATRFEWGVMGGDPEDYRDTLKMHRWRAWLGLLAVGPRSDALKASVAGDRDRMEVAFKILTDRRPEWIGDWLESQMAEGPELVPLESIRQLVLSGLIPRPKSQAYAATYVFDALNHDHLEKPDLVEDLWLIFQFDLRTFTGGFGPEELTPERWGQFRIPQNRFQTYYKHVIHILYFLMTRGVIDRQRVLDEIVAAVWRDFQAPSRKGLTRLYELLMPTNPERLRRQHPFRELLRHEVGTVVGFALDELKAMQADAEFDVSAFLDALPSVFLNKSKATAKTACAMLKTIVKRDASRRTAAIQVLVAALQHEAPEIQDTALELLENWSPSSDHDLWGQLQRQRDLVSLQCQSRLDQLLRELAPETSSKSETPASAGIDSESMDSSLANGTECIAQEIEAVRQQIERLPMDLRDAFQLDESLRAVMQRDMLPPVDLDRLPCVLSDLQPVQPIRDLEELIDCVSQATVAVTDALTIERIFDGILRFAGTTLNDFEVRTSALRKRLMDDDVTEARNGPLMHVRIFVPDALRLVKDWIEQEGSSGLGLDLRPGEQGGTPTLGLLQLRARAIRLRVQKREAGPLLSLPTHEHGWIDGRVLVQRLQATLSAGHQPSQNDFVYALLRLAPDFRDEVISQSRSLPEPFGRLLRYALKGDEPVSSADQEWAAAWLAAGRTRCPRSRLPELECLQFPTDVNATVPARFAKVWHVDVLNEVGWINRKTYAGLETPIPSSVNARSHPTISLAQGIGQLFRDYFCPKWVDDWRTTLWPANADCSSAEAVDRLMMRLNVSGTIWFNLDSFLQPLLASEINWTPICNMALCLSLACKQPTLRGFAVDALIGGLQDGRAHPTALAYALSELLLRDWFKINRLTESLREAARVSRWATLVIAEVIHELIQQQSLPSHHLLQLQLDLLIELKTELPANVKAVLERITGSSKFAKLARQLRQLTGEPNQPTRTAALLEGLRLRVDRAARIEAFMAGGC